MVQLPLDIFKTVVAHTPLISIDLIVRAPDGRVLLGKRCNRPAQGYWFVPGGRIAKDESFEQAYERLLQVELGCSSDQVERRFLGVYQHFYDDNFSGEDFSTHYVVLGYEVQLKEELAELPDEQHSEYCWMKTPELLENDNVHRHSKWYFMPHKMADSFSD